MHANNSHPMDVLYKLYKEEEKVVVIERNTKIRHIGILKGFDQHMNIVIEQGKKRYMIKGDCISCIFRDHCQHTIIQITNK